MKVERWMVKVERCLVKGVGEVEGSVEGEGEVKCSEVECSVVKVKVNGERWCWFFW